MLPGESLAGLGECLCMPGCVQESISASRVGLFMPRASTAKVTGVQDPGTGQIQPSCWRDPHCTYAHKEIFTSEHFSCLDREESRMKPLFISVFMQAMLLAEPVDMERQQPCFSHALD